MTGKTFDQSGQRQAIAPRSPVVLSVDGLTRARRLSTTSRFTIRKGETLGLTGLLGAGRTELALSIFGMRRPDRGTISLDGDPVDLRSNRDAIRAGIGYLSEDRLSLGLIQPQSIADNLVLPVLDKILERGLISHAEEAGLVGALDRRSGDQDRPAGQTRSRRSRAAISSASRSPNGWRRSRSCSSSTARPSASMSARAPASSRSCTGWRARASRSC